VQEEDNRAELLANIEREKVQDETKRAELLADIEREKAKHEKEMAIIEKQKIEIMERGNKM